MSLKSSKTTSPSSFGQKSNASCMQVQFHCESPLHPGGRRRGVGGGGVGGVGGGVGGERGVGTFWEKFRKKVHHPHMHEFLWQGGGLEGDTYWNSVFVIPILNISDVVFNVIPIGLRFSLFLP
jgi:hypothetical protein